MKNLLVLLLLWSSAAYSQLPSWIIATFANKNVYKTKTQLNLKKAYEANKIPSTDTRIYLLSPGAKSIRYKVILDEGDYKYIKVLPLTSFDASPGDTVIRVVSSGGDNSTDCIFQINKKELVPNNHYLTSSALVGKVITLPIRQRTEYWDDKNKIIQGTLALGYSFGWKYKLGGNPYRSRYLSTIIYGAGVSSQKYYFLLKDVNNKDSASGKTDEFAVTYFTCGIAYEADKFSIGLFAGKDKMFGRLKNWVFQDKWWFGLGIGYELFK